MAKVFVEDAVKQCEDGQFDLITFAAKRAREISRGSKPLVESDSIKPTTLAIEEIEQGLYTKEHYLGNIKSAEEMAEEAKQKEESHSEHQFTESE